MELCWILFIKINRVNSWMAFNFPSDYYEFSKKFTVKWQFVKRSSNVSKEIHIRY